MKINLSDVARYLPLMVGLVILAVGSLFVPWSKVTPYLTSIPPSLIGVLLLLGVIFYFGRIIRFWLLLRILGQPLQLRIVTVAYLIAQPMSMLPGGELYRSVMLKKYGDISLRNGLPSVFAQSLTESIGLLIIALLGAAFLNKYFAFMLIIAGLFAGFIAFVRWHSARKSHKLLNRLPRVNVSFAKVRTFLEKNRVLLSGRNFLILLVTSYISTIAGIAVLYLIAHEFGADISIVQAAIAFALPVMLQFISFLPAGLGVNEQGSVGVLALFGVGLALAVAITIVVRMVTVVLGFIFGFMAMAWVRVAGYKEYH